jgi:glycosyltransferase involved in cell wall biosynthesis
VGNPANKTMSLDLGKRVIALSKSRSEIQSVDPRELFVPLKVVALIPAYNASRTLEGVVARIPCGVVDRILIVDDGSTDGTYELMRRLPGVDAIRHDVNRGYGGAQATLYRAALDSDAELSVILHADGGHRPEEIPAMLAPAREGRADVVVGSRLLDLLAQARPIMGSRRLGAVMKSPMPPHRVAGHLALTALQNACYGTAFHAFHDGFRVCTREALTRVPFDRLTKCYQYDTEFLLASHKLGLRIAELPVSSYYDARAGSSVPVVRYGFEVVRRALSYRLAGRKATG